MRNTTCSDRAFSAEAIQDFSRDFDLLSTAYKQRTQGKSFHRSVQLLARQKWGHLTEGRTDFIWAQDSVCTKLLQGSKPNQSAKKPNEETVSNLKTDICLTSEDFGQRQRSGITGIFQEATLPKQLLTEWIRAIFALGWLIFFKTTFLI